MTTAAASAQAPDVDVIIVAHDSGASLQRAVASVVGQVSPGRVIVADAASTDGSVAATVAAHPDVRVIQVEDRGFSAANNVAIAATSGEFVLLLSPHAELDDRCLGPLVSRARSNRTVAIVSPKIVDPEGSLLAGSFGQFPNLARVTVSHLNAFAHRLTGGLMRGGDDIGATMTVDWVSDTCMLVRRTAVTQSGPLDEAFRSYYEDVEWCHRMRDHGWTVLIEPKATCVSRHGGSNTDSPAELKAGRESFNRYCRLYRLSGLAAAARVGLGVRLPGSGR